MQTYALVGSWHYRPSPRGFAVYRYDAQTAAMERVIHTFEHLSVGSQAVDADRGLVYVCDERGDRRGEIGGGGYIAAIAIDPASGAPALLNEKNSLAPEPSYICLDKSKKYVLVVHHCDGGHVTRVERDAQGRFVANVYFDDAAVALFALNADGSLGDCVDVAIPAGDGRPGPHAQAKLHAIVPDPTGEIYMVCDKGTDSVYAYKVNREAGRLVLCDTLAAPEGYSPRYGAFHPTLPVFYFNNEKKPVVCLASYDAGGNMRLMGEAALLEDPQVPGEASDIAMRDDGSALYVSERTSNRVIVFAVDARGNLERRQAISCGGANPRGLRLSPDGRFLLCANSDTDGIARFAVAADGTLAQAGEAVASPCPANIHFITL